MASPCASTRANPAASAAYYYPVGLLLFYIVTYLIPLGWRPLWAPDEIRYAQIGDLMLRSGDAVVPHFLGLRYFEKPILAYWANAGAQWLLGGNNAAVRASCAVAAGGCAVMVYTMARLLWRDQRLAACCTLVFMSMLMVFCTGTYLTIDAPLMLWVGLTMLSMVWAYVRNTRTSRWLGYIGVGLASGAGVMTKGFIALAMPALVLTPWLLVTRRWRDMLTLGPLAVVVAVATVLPWGIAVQQHDPDFWSFFFWHEHIQRFFSQTEAQHDAPFYFFVPILILGVFPWWRLAFRVPWAVGSMTRDTRCYLLFWAFIPFLFFSCAHGKLAPYILPCFPALGLLVGYALYQAICRQTLGLLRWNGALLMAAGLAALCVLITLGRSYFPLPADTVAYAVAIVLLVAISAIGGLLIFMPRLILLAAFTPTLLAWGVPFCLPDGRIYDKAPVVFAQKHVALLRNSAVLASNDISEAAAISWLTKRDDIVIYDVRGELDFGLKDRPERWVSEAQLPLWLSRMRRCGRVTLMLDNSDPSTVAVWRETPDTLDVHGNYSLASFSALPADGADSKGCPIYHDA